MDWMELDKTRKDIFGSKDKNPMAVATMYLADVVRYCFSGEMDEEEEDFDPADMEY
jgi:hypothetical protein